MRRRSSASPSSDLELGAQLLGGIYANTTDGFRIPDDERARIRDSGGSPVYGELTPGSVRRLIERLELGDGDVFYDLGSGLGKVVLQVAMTTPVKRCVGVELSKTRTREARSALKKANDLGLVTAEFVAFRVEDLVDARFDDATVIYCCSTAFTLRFLRSLSRRIARVPKLRTFVSLREIDLEHFEKIETMKLDASWCRGVRVHLYRLSSET